MKNLKNNILIVFSCCILISQAKAQTANQINREQDQTIQNQQQFEREKIRQNEIKRIEEERESIKKKSEVTPKLKIKDDSCIQIEHINFSQNKILTKREEKFLTKNHINKCLAASEIEQILKEINDHLSSRGFITSRAVLNDKKLGNELEIEIIEGRLEDLIFNDDGFFDKTQKFMAFGIPQKDRAFNIKYIERGLDQINRLQSNSAQIKIFPGSQKNSSVIALHNQPKNTLRASFVLDDLGSRVTGKTRDTIGLAVDNLLHLNDSFSISRSANDFSQHKEDGRNNSVNSSFSIPFKNHLLSFSYSNYSYLFRTAARSVNEGYTKTKSLNLESTLFKNNKYKLASNFGLTNREAKNFAAGALQEVNSRKSTNFIFALPNTFYLKDANLFIKPSYVQGLKILDAKKDDPEIPSNGTHSQFEMLKLYSYYSTNLSIPKTEIPFNYVISFDGQVSKQKLYSNDQIFIGGPYTVRGFENGAIGGDSGYNIKNEVKFNIGKTLSQFADFSKLPSSAKWLHNFSISPFYDYGYVREKGGIRSGRLSGTGIKTGFNYKNVTANLTYAWVTSKSVMLGDQYQENQAVYFDITTELGFF